MSNLITLLDFQRESEQYYVYRRKESSVSHAPHYHDYYQLCFIISGSFRHSQGDDSVLLHAGEAFIVPPGFVHRLHFIGTDAELYTLAFQDSFLRADIAKSNTLSFLKDLRTHNENSTIHLRLVPEKKQADSIRDLFECLLRQQDTDCPPDISAAPYIISAIVNILAQCYYQNPQHKRQPWHNSDNGQLLRRCIAYVDTNFTDPLSADTLAKQFGLSRTTLCSIFQQHTGLPVHKYIAQKRIEKAQLLIRSHPELSLSQIAGQSGYDDDSTFYRNFLKIAGVTPSGYREYYNNQRK